ncbi:MAG: hypothetical protein EOO36_08290 [Cytophagaceae bacterium]|nr:MAG: hypothetical protein EOO36_08290 [Cytophagaceae bacterium]
MNRVLPLADTRYRVLAALLAVALLLSGALNCFLLSRTEAADLRPATFLADDDEADNLSATRAELTLTQTLLARCQGESLRHDSTHVAALPPGH